MSEAGRAARLVQSKDLRFGKFVLEMPLRAPSIRLLSGEWVGDPKILSFDFHL
jgi:hypothetical protein